MLLAVATFSLSCVYDSTPPKTPAPVFKDLSQKGHVLNNFEVAHNKRDNNHYDALLDDNFTLYYTEGDVVGGSSQVQWGRSDDVALTSSLFASVDKLSFDLSDPNGAWTETPAPGGLENWYAATVFYDFTIKMGDTTYIPNAGAKMQVTVRNAGTEAKPQWKLVELHDLGGSSFLKVTQMARTKPTTYGEVKALFR